MNHEEFKKLISKKTYIPIPLLTGETPEEDIAIARALVAFRAEHDKEFKTTRQQFAEYLAELDGVEVQSDTQKAINELEDSLRTSLSADMAQPSYPRVTDLGEANVQTGDGRPTNEQFAEWLGQQTAFDPRKDNGWTQLI